ncbi:5'-nucleotidase [Flavobacteriaceae bacterium]|nr:5'-nucleotidase [Flavobacteriaceae bacterium]
MKVFGAHIFFDDQYTHLVNTSKFVPSAKVPYVIDSPMKKMENEKKKQS